MINHYEYPLVVDNYKYRCPYDADFFTHLAARYDIDQTSCVLDLCSGQGEVAGQLAPLCQTVLAVDQSALMLSKAVKYANVIYLQGDVNSMEFLKTIPDKQYHAIFVGRGIHWISLGSLSVIAKSILASSGYFFTVQSGLMSSNTWLSEYYQLLEKRLYTPQPRRDTVTMGKVLNAGFFYVEHLSKSFNQSIDIDFLLGQAMSYRVERALEVEEKKFELRDELHAKLHKYMVDGYLLANMFSSAYVYSTSLKRQP